MDIVNAKIIKLQSHIVKMKFTLAYSSQAVWTTAQMYGFKQCSAMLHYESQATENLFSHVKSNKLIHIRHFRRGTYYLLLKTINTKHVFN